MAWDSAPWIIGGGVEHSTNVCRLLAYVAAGGREGIIGSKDLEVRELASPGASVRVYPGAAIILNRALGLTDEAYAARLPSQDTVSIAATGAGVNRSDLIVARVENPFIDSEPWDEPPDPNAASYVFTRVISNVPNTTKRITDLSGDPFSAIALARIDLPPSTSTVTQARITDLRELSQVLSDQDFAIFAPTATETLTGGSYGNWPTEASVNLDVPDWATHAAIQAILGGVNFGASGNNGGAGWNAAGDLRIKLGTDVYSSTTRYNVSTDSGVDRVTLMAGAASLAIPVAKRGANITVRLEGRKTSGSSRLESNAQTTVSLLVEWLQSPEANL